MVVGVGGNHGCTVFRVFQVGGALKNWSSGGGHCPPPHNVGATKKRPTLFSAPPQPTTFLLVPPPHFFLKESAPPEKKVQKWGGSAHENTPLQVLRSPYLMGSITVHLWHPHPLIFKICILLYLSPPLTHLHLRPSPLMNQKKNKKPEKKIFSGFFLKNNVRIDFTNPTKKKFWKNIEKCGFYKGKTK